MEGDTAAVVRLRGTPVSPGLARGPLVVLADEGHLPARECGSADAESTRMRAAIAAASAELATLAAALDVEAQTILAFQIAMLADPVVIEPALAAVELGDTAEQAWRSAMDLHIRDYHRADDLYFRARASDLRDMRDRVLLKLGGTGATAIPPGSIVVAADLPPSRFLEVAWEGGGVALMEGSPNSHVAMLARSRGVPMLIGLERADLRGHAEALIDTDDAVLVASPDHHLAVEFAARQQHAERTRAELERNVDRPAVTGDGERVQLLINVADGSELDGIDPACCDGVGLVRTELMLRDRTDVANEEKQYQAYCRILRWANGRPVTIRTLDAGGDKPIAGYTVDDEANPFLGMRGVRLSLLHSDVFSVQLRALARAAALGPLKVMVPMVTAPRELDRVHALLERAIGDLRKRGTPCAAPELGMMVEVPTAALTIDRFAADFFSIGSNDLIQYLTASSRDAAGLAQLQEPLQPAVLRLIREIVDHAHARRIPVSLCGDMASDVRCIPALLDLGLRCLSVAPAAVARVKGAVARHRMATAKAEPLA
ncbi:MAG TPA: phosphoenolpyruvate--protein phosphotransferase [Casimicrobiaceae bacterium]|nr:phosphoenolpyruvate--protein phosphotransferase [Casimicrobiaceae bacterium]